MYLCLRPIPPWVRGARASGSWCVPPIGCLYWGAVPSVESRSWGLSWSWERGYLSLGEGGRG